MLRTITLTLALALSFVGCASDETSDQDTIHLPPPAEENTGEGTTEGGGRELRVGEDACETDADCVPAGCCHAAACVGTANAPDCTDMMCTQECRYGTLDCGGRCLCHEGRCAARLSEAPNLPE